MLIRLGILSILGYKKFVPTEVFTLSSRKYWKIAPFHQDTDPIFFTIESASGSIVKIWSFLFNDIIENKEDLSFDDEVNFKSDLFINDDGFIIKPTDNDSFFKYHTRKVITRPTLKSLDKINDLGDKIFILSNAGVLFSTYEFVTHKLVEYTEDENLGKLIYEPNKLVYKCSKSIVGEYGSTFEIQTVEVFPKWNR